MTYVLIIPAGLMLFFLLSGDVIGETSVVMNLRSALMVIGGSFICAIMAFPLRTIKDLLWNLRNLTVDCEPQMKTLARDFRELARIARLQGANALEAAGRKATNAFVRKGIELVVDGCDRHEIRNMMEKEFELYLARRESQVNVLNTLARIAPVFGFVGTIIGLINVLSNMGDPAQIGKGMALALLTTFYGLLVANFLFLPLAKKLSEKVKTEAMFLQVILEGIMDISEQKNAAAIFHRLGSFVDAYELGGIGGRRKKTRRRADVLRMPATGAAVRK